MKLIDLIEYLTDKRELDELYAEYQVDEDSEDEFLIYLKESLSIDSEVTFFMAEQTEDYTLYETGGIKYIQLFPLPLAKELLDELELKGKGLNNLKIAQRLLEYRIKDA